MGESGTASGPASSCRRNAGFAGYNRIGYTEARQRREHADPGTLDKTVGKWCRTRRVDENRPLTDFLIMRMRDIHVFRVGAYGRRTGCSGCKTGNRPRMALQAKRAEPRGANVSTGRL